MRAVKDASRGELKRWRKSWALWLLRTKRAVRERETQARQTNAHAVKSGEYPLKLDGLGNIRLLEPADDGKLKLEGDVGYCGRLSRDSQLLVGIAVARFFRAGSVILHPSQANYK